MAQFANYAPGQFSWVDLMTQDPSAAASFYGSLFGWKADGTQDDTGAAYTMFRLGEAVLVDPSGARISPWEPGRHKGSGLAVTVENAAATAARAQDLGAQLQMRTRDAEAAAEFYSDLFGWQIGSGDAENGYREIKLGERLNGGILPWREEMGDVPPSWSVYFAVADCDAAVAQVKALGGKLLAGPVDIEPGRFAVVADSQGAVFNLMYLKSPDA